MDYEERQNGGGAGVTSRGGWYFIKGVPIAVIVTLALGLGSQTIAWTWFMASLWNSVQIVSDKQDKTDVKLDRLTVTVQEASTPSAVNAARISSLETTAAELKGRVSENERQIIRMQAAQAATDLRARAWRER